MFKRLLAVFGEKQSPAIEEQDIVPLRPKLGLYNGKHYTEYVEEVKQLRRSGQDQQAEQLLLHLVEATESEARSMNWGLPPWYTEQLAIIYRKRKDYAAEIAIIERYRSFTLTVPDRRYYDAHAERLAKAKLLLHSQSSMG